MSAYGAAIQRYPPSTSEPPTLLPRSYPLPNSTDKALTVFPVTRATVSDELVEYLRTVFNDVVDEGRTYPQVGEQTFEQFAAYFFGADCFVGVLDVQTPEITSATVTGIERDPQQVTLEGVRAGRDWKDCVLGMYYIKPNYPGRASHNCNGGFVVPTVHRGLKVGLTLGRSYLYFAPILGYKGSVFNLVFVNNTASLKIWDQLGFTRAGLIPKAGLLKTVDGKAEEYVDAVVFHYDFTASR
ncbi:hypothetical protein OIV83_000686 [Microbotryomycetes sp. JL201]|nr:hypothetical protein OIV83_000686 [Microbotryomycetes sp. JL201]